MDNNDIRPIKVEFPSSMEVHSPDIEAVSRSTKTLANLLTDNMKKIVEPLQHLTKLPEHFTNLSKNITKQFTSLFTNQTESTIMNRQASVKVLGKKIGFIEQHITKKEEQLDKTINNITKRFEGISDERAIEHKTFLEKLDSHVYNITGNIYPQHIQRRFSFDSKESIDFLVNHSDESALIRTVCITESYLSAKDKADNFIGEREQFYQSLSDHSIETEDAAGNYNLPYWFAELEDTETGERELKIFFSDNIEKAELHPETKDTINSMAEERTDRKIKPESINEEYLNELKEVLKQAEIRNEDIDRFISDSKTVINEI